MWELYDELITGIPEELHVIARFASISAQEETGLCLHLISATLWKTFSAACPAAAR